MGLGWAYSFLSTLAHHLNFMVGPTNKAVWEVRFGYFLPNLLLRMRRNGHKTSHLV